MPRAIAHMLDDRRLHLQDGPIDLIIEADGSPHAVRRAHAAVIARFATILDELCAELPLLRLHADAARPPSGVVARRMWAAVLPFAHETFITPMAAVAGSVADEILNTLIATSPPLLPERPWRDANPVIPTKSLPPTRSGVGIHGPRPKALRLSLLDPDPRSGRGQAFRQGDGEDGALCEGFRGSGGEGVSRAYVNNGGDVALHLGPGQSWRIGLVDRPDRPSLFGTTMLRYGDGIGGIATSGWRGRSFSLGIADAVTVLAATAAEADAAATIIANAVDLAGHPAIKRIPASDLQPDSDLGARLVTSGVGSLSPGEIATALAAGATCAESLVRRGLIMGAALHLAGTTRVVEKGATGLQPHRELIHA